MRTVAEDLLTLWSAGGPFIGPNKSHGRVTVEPDWELNLEWGGNIDDIEDATKLPYRWFQDIANDQVEVEVPNVRTIAWERSLKADSGTCTVTIANVATSVASVQAGVPGTAGAYTWAHGHPAAASRWGQTPNSWWEVLIPNALIRTYEGYGGFDGSGNPMPIATAVAGGYLYLTGLWLVDEVNVDAKGTLTLTCRDMAKLLIEQIMYSPMSPAAWNPPAWRKWTYQQHTSPAVPYYDFTDPVQSGPGNEGPKYITDVAVTWDGKGYYLVGTDGGVFTFGRALFYGSRGGNTDTDSMVSIATNPVERGYWLLSEDGGVFTFGPNLDFYGNGAGGGTPDYRRIEATPTGKGYWLLRKNGTVEEFGDAVHYGDNPATVHDCVDICSTPTGEGYWILTLGGEVYTYGDALYYGGSATGIDVAMAMATPPTGKGYWIMSANGVLTALGAARNLRLNGDDYTGELNDPMVGLASTRTGLGLYSTGGDGGVFTFGDAKFYGSLPEGYQYETRHPGNYSDLSDIVEALLKWAGWWAKGSDSDVVYGNIETTGTYLDEEVPIETFDRRPIIDGINAMREIVNYGFWIDEEGAAHFESYNFYALGNFDENGNHTTELPVIDERYVLSDYAVNFSDRNVKSKIIISSHDPKASLDDVVVTKRSVTENLLGLNLNRGMVRPYLWVNDHWSTVEDQLTLIERIVDLMKFSLRRGTVRCVANPQIQMNDQVRIYERVTAETFVHWVEGIRSEHDVINGVWQYDLTTGWLGDDWGE